MDHHIPSAAVGLYLHGPAPLDALAAVTDVGAAVLVNLLIRPPVLASLVPAVPVKLSVHHDRVIPGQDKGPVKKENGRKEEGLRPQHD